MRNRPRLRGPAHAGVRTFLRIAGPVVLFVGIALIATGILTVVAGDPFRHKFLAATPFLGMPMTFVGLVMTAMGYMGAVTRYQAGEIAPVVKDTFNYVADGTQDGVRDLARAIGEGLSGKTSEPVARCAKCGETNDHDAKFCDHCGEAMLAACLCADCGEVNDADARFCDACGGKLTGSERNR